MPSIEEPSNARSRRTRAALLDGAREILETEGYPALNMASLADRAGVTRAGVYLHFDSVPAVMAELFDHLAETEGLEASLDRVWQAPDALSALERWASHLAEYHPRLMAVDLALQQAEASDEAAAAHRARVAREQMANCRRLARWLEEEGRLADPWTSKTAADVLYGLVSSELITRWTVDRRWSGRRLREHLALLLSRTLTDR